MNRCYERFFDDFRLFLLKTDTPRRPAKCIAISTV